MGFFSSLGSIASAVANPIGYATQQIAKPIIGNTGAQILNPGGAAVQYGVNSLNGQEQGNVQQYQPYQINQSEQQQLLNQARQNRAVDLAQGRQRGQELFGQGQLGRLDASNPEISTIIQKRQESLQGMSPQEQALIRGQSQQALQQSLGQNRRQLAQSQAASGVRGGVAASQQAGLGNSALRASLDNERNLQLQNLGLQRNALQGFEQSAMQRAQYNQGQANKESLGQLGTELGYGGLGAGDRAAIIQQLVGQQQANATAQAGQAAGSKK